MVMLLGSIISVDLDQNIPSVPQMCPQITTPDLLLLELEP